ncbi:ATP-grasp domain-containing protein [Candidatus Woesearchaeota archaeon]|nr:ATP-grasp domain-containing protein [Candidatus Woesearchaeota archaeon]
MKTIGMIYSDNDGLFVKSPFKRRYTYSSYKKFSEIGQRHGFKTVIARPEWYTNRKFSLCWNLLTSKIEKDIQVDFVLDRCISLSMKHHKFMKNLRKKIKKQLILMNDPYIENVCTDKYLTYRLFGNYLPKTFFSLKDLRKIKTGLVVLKPRFGSGGRGIQIREKGAIKKLKKDYLLQEFIDTSRGVKGLFPSVHDLRVLVLNGKIIDFYVRAPRKGLISNVHLGGRVVRVRGFIPKKVESIALKVDKKFSKFRPRLYSIDFLLDKGQKPFVTELNSQVGFDIYYQFKGQAKIYEKICESIISSIAGVV